jgi:hypothetical protein
MLDTATVINRFTILSGIETADNRIQAICLSSASHVSSLLKSNEYEEDIRVINAAASDAYYVWVMLECVGDDADYKSFRAGDITIHSNSSARIEAARLLRQEAFENASVFFKDNSFYFGGVDTDDSSCAV